jgi:hypothetical protein
MKMIKEKHRFGEWINLKSLKDSLIVIVKLQRRVHLKKVQC